MTDCKIRFENQQKKVSLSSLVSQKVVVTIARLEQTLNLH